MIINEEEKLKRYIEDNRINAEHIRYQESLHTVQDLLKITGLDLERITKTMIFEGKQGETIAAMVPAKFRVSTTRLGEALESEPPEIANPDEAYKRTGYPCGGMPCFGYDAILIIDPKVLEKEYVYTGGGSEFSIVKISSVELKKLNPLIKRIYGNKSN
ncbi:Aminoacyl-tRNA editing domain protein [uncultured archaeon]|nr:Aminoacyl-tRNA editing domain protein [uncultured archaeon]